MMWIRMLVAGVMLSVNLSWADSGCSVVFGHFDPAGGPLTQASGSALVLPEGAPGEILLRVDGEPDQVVSRFAANGSRLFGHGGYFLTFPVRVDPAWHEGALLIRIWNGRDPECAGGYWESPAVPADLGCGQVSFSTHEWSFHRAANGQSTEQIDQVESGSTADVFRFALHSNYPNPFNATTTVPYDLAEAADVQILLHDLLGRWVATLYNGARTAGRHRLQIDGSKLAAGTYLLTIRTTAGDRATRRIMLLK